MRQQDKKQKFTSRVLWVVIILLLAVLIYQNLSLKTTTTVNGPALGPAGTEYYNQDMTDKKAIKSDKIGASVPASVTVGEGGNAAIQIKNTGKQKFIPYCIINGKEVYRASKVLAPGDRVIAIIQVGTSAIKVDTMIETLDGGKFSITSKIVR